jgi:hypothetical protein
MAIEERTLADFTGGEISLRSALEGKENQWLLLEGLVLDSNKRLRSQWSGVTWKVDYREFNGTFILDDETNGLLDGEDTLWEKTLASFTVIDFGILTGRILAVSDEPTNSGWYISDIPNGLVQPEWEKIETPDENGVLRIAGQMAYQVVDDEDSAESEVFWVDALLCNSATETDVDPFAVYIDPRTNETVVKSWSSNTPDDENGTSDSMPHAGRCTMWGDFLVLGDIVWKSDPDQAFSDENKSRYRHGLWFSIPGKTDTWDPIDTVFTGQKAGRNVVQGMFPLEQGLLVVTCTLVALLQGSPDGFIYRELRSGISNCGRNGVAAWPSKGGVVWVDSNNYVWFSNGESFIRFDEAIEINGPVSIAAEDEYLFVSTSSVVHVFRLFEEDGGWTRITGTFGFSKIITTSRYLFGLEERDPVGSFILDDETNGLLDGEDSLWGQDRYINAFDFNESVRGKINGRNISPVVRTRPLPGFGHSVRFWHKFGLRAKGSGFLRKAVSRPSADLSVRGLETRISGDLKRRFDYVFDAHGPSIEATFDVEFEGDITVEHMTVWEHGGRTQR